jgi:hypothetical protein
MISPPYNWQRRFRCATHDFLGGQAIAPDQIRPVRLPNRLRCVEGTRTLPPAAPSKKGESRASGAAADLQRLGCCAAWLLPRTFHRGPIFPEQLSLGLKEE